MVHTRRILTIGALVYASVLGVPAAIGAPVSVQSAALTTFHTCVLTGTAASGTTNVDSYVNQASPVQNNGTNSTTTVNSAALSNTRTYIQFDLTTCIPAIPSSATVNRATLRLFVTALPGVCRTDDIFRVTSSWTESGVTWNNQPFGTTINNPPSAQATSSMTLGTGCAVNTATSTYVTGWNVTSDVSAFVAGTATNNGWMVRDDVEGSVSARSSTFSARNANNPARGPQLVVDYTT